MPTTPDLALRYPASTDRVADGAVAIQHLAEDVEAKLRLAYDPPRCRAHQTAPQNVSSGVLTTLLFQAESVDTDAMHSTVTNTGRLTVTTPGRYRVTAACGIAQHATGSRTLRIAKNGATVAATRVAANTAAASTIMQVTDSVLCVAGDYIEATFQQDAGGILSTNGTSDTCFLEAKWDGIQ